MMEFSYEHAFARNIGWLTEDEQKLLRTKRVAIGGLGGVGGSYLLALVRLGFEKLNITDLDTFDLSNFNRQVGAHISSLNQPKLTAMGGMAHDINPNVEFKCFADGLNDENYKEFLNGVDIYLDSLDLYATPLKMKIFTYCHQQGIPIVTAAPIGMSTSLLIFNGQSMAPETYFGVSPKDAVEIQIIRFLIGVSPTMRALKNLVQRDGLHIKGRKLPSTIIGIELCTAVACSSVLKILLKRGPLYTAPTSSHFDAYTNNQYLTRRPFGRWNPLQWLMYQYMKRRYLS